MIFPRYISALKSTLEDWSPSFKDQYGSTYLEVSIHIWQNGYCKVVVRGGASRVMEREFKNEHMGYAIFSEILGEENPLTRDFLIREKGLAWA